MIKVIVERDKNSGIITSIEVKGHSNSNQEGKDLICAGVSAIIDGGFNALDSNSFSFSMDKGYALANAIKEISQNDSVVLETIVVQLKTIAESYPDYVKILND